MKCWNPLVVLLLALLMTACAADMPSSPSTVPTTAPTTIPTTEPTSEPTTEPTTEPTAELTTEPTVLHSELYIEGVSVEDVLRYFNEVVLDSEFSNGGDSSLVQKWEQPITYWVGGDPSEADLHVLEAFTTLINGVEGFPGFVLVEDEWSATLPIYFCDNQELQDRMGPDFTGGDYEGAITYWYSGNNDIFRAIICIRSDIDQYTRNSVIQEELYNGLGPVQDTRFRQDSIIYQYGSEAQTLTDVDLLLVRLLYHRDIRCGMNQAECEAVIRQLYY